jgi:hypothetical protein
MHKQRLAAAGWHACRALFGFAIWLYMAHHLMKESDDTSWILRITLGLVLLGGVSNVVVVVLNRGVMPVRSNIIEGRRRLSYQPIHSGTRLWFLGDCIRLGSYYASPGDVLLYAGSALTMVGVALRLFL